MINIDNSDERIGIEKTVNFLIDFVRFPILQINGRFYIVLHFEESSTNILKHVLKGKDVTDIVLYYRLLHGLDQTKQTEITNKVLEKPELNKEFHSSIPYILTKP